MRGHKIRRVIASLEFFSEAPEVTFWAAESISIDAYNDTLQSWIDE